VEETNPSPDSFKTKNINSHCAHKTILKINKAKMLQETKKKLV
jgi:hypothetical protein